MEIKSANSSDLFKRLDEIDGELQDFHISAYRCDLLYKEQDSLKAELRQRGYKINGFQGIPCVVEVDELI